MTDENTISIIMSCYNSEKTLKKAIDSILAQTWKNWVMICCDDASADGTLEILNAYHKQYPDKFVVLHNETNRKLPYSLNRCLSQVRTELVARMDADDWCMPERLEKQVAFLKSHSQYDLVGTGVSVWDGEKTIASIVKIHEPTCQTMIRQNAFSHATIMTYKRVYDVLGGYSEDPWAERVEDVDLWCRFLAAGFRGYNLPEKLYVILESVDAVKRRTLRARLNSAVTRYRGYTLMGIRGWQRYRPFLNVLKAFVPTAVYRAIHLHSYKNRKKLVASEKSTVSDS